MSEPSKPARCPICRKALISEKESGGKEAGRFAPFCSQRCADLDLGRWLKGSYVVPGVEAETPETGSPPEDDEA
jgi:endogenous inhibitor of DNA gyrase (YacG/DUF329 family)